jgi:C4-dicarboxylate transporter DctM subunit
MAALFMLTVIVACLSSRRGAARTMRASWRSAWPAWCTWLPPLAIFLLVVGSIYAGLATPTEAAALGVVGALVLAPAAGRLSFRCCAKSSKAPCVRPR